MSNICIGDDALLAACALIFERSIHATPHFALLRGSNVISRLPPLTTLRLFESAGRHGSFKLAARELGLTPSAVSHGVASLERGIDTALFDRGVRGISLTPSGKEFLRFVTDAFASIADGMQRLPSRPKQRSISLSCAPLVAARWLLPRLRQYIGLHGDVSINIDTARRHVDFPSDGFDLAIRMGNGGWPHVEATLLFNATLLPVCAPDHFKEVALDGSVIDLRKTTTLHVTSASEDWSTWIKATGNSDMQLKGSLRFDTIQLAIDAAIAGLGTAVGRIPFIQEELADGRLVRAGPSIKSKIGYWLIKSETTSRTEVSAFKNWLIEQSAERSTGMPSRPKQTELRSLRLSQ